MFFTNLFNFHRTCQHEKITPDLETAYCPDCGELVRNDWYITRCECCGIKLKTNARNGKIFPQERFCKNCGSQEYRVEKLEKINFIDVNFAVLVKQVIKETTKVNTTQCWQERKFEQPKLLVQYL